VKLYERFGDKGFHTSIVTTFGVDFDTYENVALPRFHGAGCNNNILLADARMLTCELDGASLLPKYAGRHYTVSGAMAKGVFHPKILLQLGRRSGRVIIGSANMTASGLAGNLELAGLATCTAEDSGERQLVATARQYVEGRIDPEQQALAHQWGWMRARTQWLFDAEPASGVVTLGDGYGAALLTSDAPIGIGTRFTALVEERPVERLIVLSPYWDEDLSALRHLATVLQPQEIIILIDRGKGLFPGAAMPDLPEAKIFDLTAFGHGRFIHAKAIIAQTRAADHVLYGSVNCTAAALGTGSFPGINDEAGLYRRLAPDTIIEALNLTKTLNSATPLEPADLPTFSIDESLPLDESVMRSPGRFECLFDTLIWRPPISMPIDPHQIELLDVNGEALLGILSPLGGASGKDRRFQIRGLQERPAFARLQLANGNFSAPAVVTLIDALRETVREARSKRAESSALRLSEETEEGLWLLEVLDSLEAAEETQKGTDDPGARRVRQKAVDIAAETEFQTLDYERFIAGRRLRSEATAVTRNSLAGSELSLVRGFLNRILSISDTTSDSASQLEEAIAAGLDLGDETANAEDALERGEEFSGPSPPVASEQPDAEAEGRKRAQVKATRDQIVQAVDRFNERIRLKAEARNITKFDILRLRAMLMIIAAAGQPAVRPAKAGKGAHYRETSLQVLPLDHSAHAWPKLFGRTIFTFFGSKRPAIRYLQIDDMHDQLPDDILECWATCFWAMQAALCAAGTDKDLRRAVLAMLSTIASQTYLLTGLDANELESDRVTSVLEGLNERFGTRLGLDPMEIRKAHARLVRELHVPALAS
jgi:hypothetical protein